MIATLSPQYTTEVRDLILKPPATNPYDKLKEELVKCTTVSVYSFSSMQKSYTLSSRDIPYSQKLSRPITFALFVIF